MSNECQDSAKPGKPANGPKPLTERTPAKARVRGKRKGYQPHQRNALYQLASAFKSNHPTATAVDAWRHFTTLAGMDAALIAHDQTTDTLTYVPHPERYGTREIKRDSFSRRYRELADV